MRMLCCRQGNLHQNHELTLSLGAAKAGTSSPSWVRNLGPGLITGDTDDDPSGIATYSQAGAQFCFSMLWAILLTYPLMVAIQVISARIGRVNGHVLATNIRQQFPAWLLHGVVGLLLFANTINIAADIAAMGYAMKLMVGGPKHLYAILFGILSLILQIFIPCIRLDTSIGMAGAFAWRNGLELRLCSGKAVLRHHCLINFDGCLALLHTH